MKLNDYGDKANRTFPFGQSKEGNMANFALGIVSEGGEVGDIIKKHLFHGHSLDVDDVEKELGDILWYIASMAEIIGSDMETIAQKNVAKLEKRYKKGFTEEESINREEDTVWENLSESERQFIHNEERKRAWR